MIVDFSLVNVKKIIADHHSLAKNSPNFRPLEMAGRLNNKRKQKLVFTRFSLFLFLILYSVFLRNFLVLCCVFVVFVDYTVGAYVNRVSVNISANPKPIRYLHALNACLIHLVSEH